jgi:hypothetical protein
VTVIFRFRLAGLHPGGFKGDHPSPGARRSAARLLAVFRVLGVVVARDSAVAGEGGLVQVAGFSVAAHAPERLG